MKIMLAALQREVSGISSLPAVSFATNCGIWLNRVKGLTMTLVKESRLTQKKTQEVMRRNEEIEKELAIVRSLRMKQNAMDLEKEKKVNEVLLSKWMEEEKEMIAKCGSVGEMMEQALGEEEVTALRECVAEVYALLEVVGVSYTLSEEKKKVVEKLIGCCREAKRKETGLCGRWRMMCSACGKEEATGETGEQEAGEGAAEMEGNQPDCSRSVTGADSEGGIREEESFVP